jgi:hypothetical protein
MRPQALNDAFSYTLYAAAGAVQAARRPMTVTLGAPRVLLGAPRVKASSPRAAAAAAAASKKACVYVICVCV